MRIGLVIYGNLDTVSGGYIYDRMLVESFEKRGDIVKIISIPWRNYTRTLLDNFSNGLKKKLLQLDVDILIQDELVHPSLFILNHQIKSKIKYPIISLVHHLRSKEVHPARAKFFYRIIEKIYLKSINAFVFVSKATMKSVIDLVGDHAPHVIANPPGNRLSETLSAEEISTRLKVSNILRILFLGSVTPRKSLDTLINSLIQLPENAYSLSVVGSLEVAPKYVSEIKKSIIEFGIKDNVIFLGNIEDQKLVDVLKHHDVLVVPSSMEGFGMVYLEGMAFGLPAVATSGGASSEIITHNIDGIIIKQDDSKSLADFLQSIINDKEKLLKMSLAARKRYDKHPIWKNTAEKIRNFILELI